MSRDRISVIIPVFNGAAELPRAIDSALAQVDCDVEVIVVNDGSKDNTADVINSYGDRIKGIHQTNSGLAATRNNGVQAATCEWVAFLDHDDYWKPEKLKLQLQAASRTGFDIVYTNAENFGDVNRVAELRSVPSEMLEGDLFQHLLLDNFIVVSSTMIRRSLLLAAGSFDHKLGVVEDWDLWLRLSSEGSMFAVVREPVTMYQWRAGSLSKNHERMRNMRLQILHRALTTERAQQLPWKLRRQALASVESCSAWFLAASEPRKAIGWYARSLVHWPFDVNCWKGIVKGCLGRS